MVTCLLIPLGHGKWQHLDFKVNAKGRALYLKMKDRQQIPGSPETTFCIPGLPFPNCRSRFDPDRNTHHRTNSSKRKLLHEPGNKLVQQPALSESCTWLSQFRNTIYRHVSKYLEMAEGNWEQSYLPHYFFFQFLDILLTWTHRNLQLSMILEVSLVYNLGQTIFEN